MNNSPLVSVIMPVFNAQDYVGNAVRSVMAQTYPHWELFIIDDSSSDNSLSISREFSEKDERITVLFNESNQGPGISRNRGIEAAIGNFIAFLDADDLWKPEKLQKQLNFMQEQQVDVCFSSYELISEDGKRLDRMVDALPFLTYQKLLKSNYVGNLTGIYNAKKLGKVYCPEIRKRQDWGMWLAAVRKAGIAKSIKEPLAFYRQRKNSISGNKLEMLRYNFNIYHRVLDFSFLKSVGYMLNFLREHFFVKKRQEKRLDQGSELL